MTYLDELFGRPGRPGVEMAAQALRLAIPQERVEVVATTFTEAVIRATGG
jgi:hypothetical protein